jgi:hypothetical protein
LSNERICNKWFFTHYTFFKAIGDDTPYFLCNVTEFSYTQSSQLPKLSGQQHMLERNAHVPGSLFLAKHLLFDWQAVLVEFSGQISRDAPGSSIAMVDPAIPILAAKNVTKNARKKYLQKAFMLFSIYKSSYVHGNSVLPFRIDVKIYPLAKRPCLRGKYLKWKF